MLQAAESAAEPTGAKPAAADAAATKPAAAGATTTLPSPAVSAAAASAAALPTPAQSAAADAPPPPSPRPPPPPPPPAPPPSSPPTIHLDVADDAQSVAQPEIIIPNNKGVQLDVTGGVVEAGDYMIWAPKWVVDQNEAWRAHMYGTTTPDR